MFKHSSTEILQTDELQFIEKQFKDEIRNHLNSPHCKYISTFEELKEHSLLPYNEAKEKNIILLPGCKISIPESLSLQCKNFMGNGATISTEDSVEFYGLQISAQGVIDGIHTESPEGCKNGQPNSKRKLFIGFDEPSNPISGPFISARFRSELLVSAPVVRNCNIETNIENRIGLALDRYANHVINNNFNKSLVVKQDGMNCVFANNYLYRSDVYVIQSDGMVFSGNKFEMGTTKVVAVNTTFINNYFYAHAVKNVEINNGNSQILGGLCSTGIKYIDNYLTSSMVLINTKCKGYISIDGNKLHCSQIKYEHILDPIHASTIYDSMNNIVNINNNIGIIESKNDEQSGIYITNYAKEVNVLDNTGLYISNKYVEGVILEKLRIERNKKCRLTEDSTVSTYYPEFNGIKSASFKDNEFDCMFVANKTPSQNLVLIKINSEYCDFIDNVIKLQVDKSCNTKYDLLKFDQSIKNMVYAGNTIQSVSLTEEPISLPVEYDNYHNSILRFDFRENEPMADKCYAKTISEFQWKPDETYKCEGDSSVMNYFDFGLYDLYNRVSFKNYFDFTIANNNSRQNNTFIGTFAGIMENPDEELKGKTCFYGLEISANDSAQITFNCVKGINQLYYMDETEKRIERVKLEKNQNEIFNTTLRLLISYDKDTNREQVCIIQAKEGVCSIDKIDDSVNVIIPVMEFEKGNLCIPALLVSTLKTTMSGTTLFKNVSEIYDPKTYKKSYEVCNYNHASKGSGNIQLKIKESKIL